jgi:hypothetical protein
VYDTGCYLPTPWRWFRTLRRQQRCADRGRRNPGDDARHQALIPARADSATQPEAGRDHQHHRQPDTAALRRDPHFFRLHVAQVAGLDHLIVMDGCGMVPPRCAPVPDGLLLEPKGMLDGDERTAPTDQGNAPRDQRLRRATPMKDGAGAARCPLGIGRPQYQSLDKRDLRNIIQLVN